MTSFLDKLNLRPQERRWVVGVMVVVIVLLNWAFIWPYFSEWSKVQDKMAKTRSDAKHYQEEILKDENPTNGYKIQLAKLEEKGGAVALEGDIQIYKSIMAQANGKIVFNNYQPITVHSRQTNEFFEEQSMKVTFADSTEKGLVDFIVGIGSDSSMIRVRELNLSPADVNRYRLRGDIVLSANYQKKVESKPAPAAAKATIGKPTMTPAPKKTGK